MNKRVLIVMLVAAMLAGAWMAGIFEGEGDGTYCHLSL